MEKNIQGVKIGNMVNLSIDGKLYKKNCGTPEEAKELFQAVLKAKESPTNENIKAIRIFLNEKLRKILMAGIEADIETGEAYLAGFNTPIPLALVDVIKEYKDNGFPTEPIINFWKLLMINPDTRVRTSLFDFISKHDFVLTDKGYMVVYKAVYTKDNVDQKTETPKSTKSADMSLVEYVSNQFIHVRKDWKTSPNKYVVYRTPENVLGITKYETAMAQPHGTYEVLGKLGELYTALVEKQGTMELDEKVKEVAVATEKTYTDMHTRSMDIMLGKPVVMDRKECDSDPARDCSYGLHVGATKYVENFANQSSAILACLVNPANVVAVPNYDHTKMRVTEYFPFAYATYKDRKIDIIEQKYFESDYTTYEHEELEKQIAKVKANELPIEQAKNAEKESRPMSELMLMLESRLVDL